MKKLVLSLLGGAAMAISSNAMALDSAVPYLVQLTRGLAPPTPLGVMAFAFEQDNGINTPIANPTSPVAPIIGVPVVSAGSCSYAVEWDSLGAVQQSAALPLSAQCFVAEAKVIGNFGCVENQLVNFNTILSLDLSFASSTDTGCQGFDQFSQFHEVSNLMLAEMFSLSASTRISGVITFDGVNGFASIQTYGIALQS